MQRKHSAGTVLRITNNDVMPHKLVQPAGPRVRLTHPNLSKMASSATVKLANVLHLTVRVK